MTEIKTLQDLIDQGFCQSVYDVRSSWERLRDLAKRGIYTPTTLNFEEIQQISFALSLLLAEIKISIANVWLSLCRIWTAAIRRQMLQHGLIVRIS